MARLPRSKQPIATTMISVVMTYGLSAWYEPSLLMCGVVVDGKVDVLMDDVVVWMAEWRKQERERKRR